VRHVDRKCVFGRIQVFKISSIFRSQFFFLLERLVLLILAAEVDLEADLFGIGRSGGVGSEEIGSFGDAPRSGRVYSISDRKTSGLTARRLN